MGEHEIRGGEGGGNEVRETESRGWGYKRGWAEGKEWRKLGVC